MQLWQRWFLYAYLFICPIAYTVTMSDLRAYQETFWHYMAMGLITLFCRNLWICLFFFWAVLLMVLNGFETGQRVIFNIFLGICMFSCARSYFKKYSIEDIYKPLLFVGGLTLFWMLLQKLGIDPLYIGKDNSGNAVYNSEFTNMIGLFGIKAHNGIFLAILTPILMGICGIWGILALFPVVLSESSAAVIGAGLAILFYCFYMKKKAFLYVLIGFLAVSIGFIAFDYNKDSKMLGSRFGLWSMVAKFSLANPIGYGPETFFKRTKNKDFMFFSDENFTPAIGIFHHKNEESGRDVYALKPYNPNYFKMHKENNVAFSHENSNRWSNAHNLFFQVMFEYGFLGLFFLLKLLEEMFHRFRMSIKSKELVIVTSCILVYLVSSMTQFPLFVARLGFLFPILLGAFYAYTERGLDESV